MTTLIVLGQRVPALARIATVAGICGISRSAGYRLAESDEWPTVGPVTSRYVVLPTLLARLGIPYEVEHEEAADEPV